MNLFHFIWKEYKAQFFIALLIFGSLISACIWKPAWRQNIDWLEAVAGIGTLLFAFFLWINSLNQNWVNSLPKRITVQYRWAGRNVMVCKDALLTNESDARTWALQIGQQLSGCQRLKFSPFFGFQRMGTKKHPQTCSRYNSYLFTYYLSEIPVPDLATPEEKENFKWKIENGCIEMVPFYNDGSVTYEETYYPSKGQAIPA